MILLVNFEIQPFPHANRIEHSLKQKYFLAFLPAFLIFFSANGQLPEQDCSGALPVCQNVYVQPNSYAGEGTQELTFGNSSCLTQGEENSVWYIWTVNVSGSLEFEITPINVNDDYDWAVYNLTNASCADIITGVAPEERCNYSAIPGSTGLSNPYVLTSVGAGGPNQCQPMNVTVGETYVLVINNHDGLIGGYTLSFGGSAVIFDNIPPSPVSIDPFPCTPPDVLHLTVSEQIRCNSISADGSDFFITGPSLVTVAGASSPGCLSGTFTNKIDVQLSGPINVNGDYFLKFKQGADGNVILDNCGNELPDTNKMPFKVAIADAEFDYEIIKTCTGDSLVFTDLSVGDTTITWSWDFGDGNTSTDINPTHMYSGTGTFDVILFITDTGGCFNKDTISISTYLEPPVAGFSVSPPPYCTDIPISFFNSSTGQGLIYKWIFGTATSSDFEPVFTFTAAGLYTVYLVVTDSIGCTDTVAANLTINPGVIADFNFQPDVLCTGDTISFSNVSTGNITSVDWDFGNGITDTSSTSVDLAYYSSGSYTVTLIIHDAVCLPDTFIELINVYDYPIVNLGNDTSICIGESIALDAGNPEYQHDWSTGAQTQAIVLNLVPQTAIVFVSNNGCVGKDTIFVDNACPFFIPTAFTPNNDGINDAYKIITDGTNDFELMIFNRWGQMVYQSSDADASWDGTYEGLPEEMGSYIYSVSIKFDNGVSRVMKGNITLIR
ncbi:MAG: PKD domain-containing protein [Chitinophagaceae bacterium]|nr:PKD domain-containing protein [Chitinophagaceae bacterium]